MTKNEKDAILGYLEFALTEMVQRLEIEKIINGPLEISKMYDSAYEVLNEMERTFTEDMELNKEEKSSTGKS